MINKVTLIGNLGQDPEIRRLENGTQVGRFSLATNESYKDKSGEWQTQTEWHNIVVWRELAERCAKLKKGEKTYVEGKLSYRKYTDKDGVEKSIADIVANVVRGLEKKESGEGSTGAFQTEPQGQNSAHDAPHQTPTTPPTAASGDNLPF